MANNNDTKIVLLVKYGEISLRKGNRDFYERKVISTIQHNLKELPGNLRVYREQGRFLIEDTDKDLDTTAVLERVKHILGITGFAICVKTKTWDMPELCRIAMDFYKSTSSSAKSFKVNTKRSDKRFPLESQQISAQIGEHIWTNSPGLQVDLHNPEAVLNIEIRNNVYFYVNSVPGVGGLPYGSSGKGVLLLSGGLDSPIAGYLTARRGVEVCPIYFHSPPFVSERAADKVQDLAQVLARYGGDPTVKVIHFTDIQLFLRDNVPEEKLTIMLKRAMLRVASAYAKSIKAQCLITGDSIGQVASQTIQSLAAVHSAASYTILRPLAAMDKQEIIDIARKLGTFDISTRPYEDCCTIFVAKHPENKPNTNVIEKLEARLEDRLAPLIEKALEDM